jgi:hypothetical protein
MTVRTISGSHSPGCLHAAVTASVDRPSANLPNMGLAIAVMHDATDSWHRHGVDVGTAKLWYLDIAKLWYLGDRSHVVDYVTPVAGKPLGPSVATLFAARRLSAQTNHGGAAPTAPSHATVARK